MENGLVLFSIFNKGAEYGNGAYYHPGHRNHEHEGKPFR